MLASATSRTSTIKDMKNGPQSVAHVHIPGNHDRAIHFATAADAAIPISLQPAHANARRTLIRVFPDAEMAAQADVAGKA
ncbi:hypothetical protein [Burkholderia ubonensis]|uniref:hypothetical protein n=1 Tax=Burkholderia ubonensis TaxID=101571 RepID=UPI000BA664F8|nr:hypothetical protein [Burkholderia ubonensis]PAK12127.1 hypothetical protein CJO66_24220 [Burkholderia ubonensis]RQP27399.1 hypothetical protein DF155_32475 [Burkholderia ubonensis]RQP30880.1 hypothetical protein DF154_30010 [Burkholderia ubonensis]RQP30993.1 hypothetical protein DF156_32380 [Burkholderia ubonensis]RQP48499.1 hypothetical protein DF144_28015 [Burkholderia ubonensis]